MSVWQYQNNTGADANVYVEGVLKGVVNDGRFIYFHAEGTQEFEAYRNQGYSLDATSVLENSPVDAGRVDRKAEPYSS